MFNIKMLVMASAGMLFVGCAQQRVTDSLAEATVVEGKQYAAEMAAQSPFKTVEMRWSEAAKLMEKRNRTYIAARATHLESTEKKPEVGEITGEMRRAVTASVGGVLSPGALIESMRNPAVQVPKQLASLAGLKDVSHNVSQAAWADAAASVDAELMMRREQVKLHRLLRTGELIDHELTVLQESPPFPEGSEPAIGAAVNEWRVALREERTKWLGEVRDLFDAEYHDVRFVRDSSGLPTYRDVEEPDLTDSERWCRLARTKELVDSLGKSHADRKSAIPGTSMVSDRFSEMVSADKMEEIPSFRDAGAVRREVRNMVQSWRKMKQAQQQSARLEERHDPPVLASVADVNARKRIYALRSTEIENAGVVWMMDEKCWE